MSRSWIRRAGMAVLPAALVLATPAAAAQRDPESNHAVIDSEGTDEFLERANSVVSAVMSYDYRDLQTNKDAVAELTTGEYQESQAALYDQIETQAPSRQLVVTSTVADSAARTLYEDEAEALVYLDQASTAAGQEQAAVAAMVLATFELVDGEWLLSDLTALGSQ